MRTHTRPLVVLVVAVLAAAVAACGTSATSTTGAARTIDVTMTDNAYQPTALTVRRGETVTFRFRNDGKARHEAVLGDDAAQQQHHQQMTATTAAPMEHGHAAGATTGATTDGVTVEPGATAELTHRFDQAGTVLIGCHEAGHWEGGMKATVTVG